MKRLIKIAAIISLLIPSAGCSDKAVPTPVVPSELECSSASDFIDVALGSEDAWYVESYPEWATPMSLEGAARESLTLFVEDNPDDSARTGEMRVLTENAEYVFTIRQKSSLTDDDNAAIVSENVLSKTNGVGYSINAFNVPSGGKYALKSAIINPAKFIRAIASEGEGDAYCMENQYSSRTESYIGTTVTQVSTQLSVNAGIDVDIAGFKASVEGKFSSTESTDMERAYAIREIQHIVASRYIRPGILRSLSKGGCDSVFVSGFKKYMEKIRQDPSDANIRNLIDRYGTHLVIQGSLGGELSLAMEMTSTQKISEMKIHAALDLSNKVISAGGNFDMDESQKEITKNTKISLTTYGGNNVYTIAPGTSFETAMSQALDAKKLNDWVAAIKNGEALSLIDIKTCPIYDLMPDEASRNAVRSYMVNQYQKERLGHGAQVYELSGFADPDVLSGYVEIPEINVRLECYRHEDLPELTDGSELPMLIYSGPVGDVNYDCGFFIGSSSKHPAKVRKNRDGSYSIEEFTDLPKQAISKLYVDPAGRVTMAAPISEGLTQMSFKMIPPALKGNWMPDIKDWTWHFDTWSNKWCYIEDIGAIACSRDFNRLLNKVDISQYEMAFSIGMFIDKVEVKFYRSRDKSFLIDTFEKSFGYGDYGSAEVVEARFKAPEGTSLIDIYLYDFARDPFPMECSTPPRLYFPIAYMTPPSWN